MSDEMFSHTGSSNAGLTKEIEILVPWGIIAGKVLGDSTNPPVLCIHGWLDNCNTFDKLIPLLPCDKYYVFIDLPGHGLSSSFPVGMFYTHFDFVALINRLTDYFEWKVFSLIGHSMGGNICCVYAGTFPEKADKLILLDVGGVYPLPMGLEVQHLRLSIKHYLQHETSNRSHKMYTFEQAKERLLGANPSLTEEAANILLERGVKKLEDGTYRFLRDFRHNYHVPTGVYAVNGLDFLSRITAETMHIIADDGITKNLNAKKMEVYNYFMDDGFNDCEYYRHVEVKGKHHVHLCHPERIIHPMTSLLERPLRPGLRSESSASKL
ncbi:unnamed protein product [Clavelina lepadiformis]|uniref:AB hydrolase-1 domain-containing protein n=1 Tax=Clavelina lepadiformis TaxID=159417 RepID=A0ABP0FTZ5_CLALP